MKISLPQGLPHKAISSYVTYMSETVKSIIAAKNQSLKVAEYFALSGDEKYIKYAERILNCSPRIHIDYAFQDRDGWDFDEDTNTLKECIVSDIISSIKDVWWCRQAQCPSCIVAKSRKRRALLFKGLPKLMADYPDCSLIFLTLTQRHIPLSELRSQIDNMSDGWKLLSQCKEFPAIGYKLNKSGKKVPIIGYLRSVEITISKTQIPGEEIMVHPHSHVIIIVPKSYFTNKSKNNYITQARWSELWRRSMKLDYDPIVDVRKAYSKNADTVNLVNVAMEAAKYITKFDDLVGFGEALPKFSEQVHGKKFFNSGGVFADYVTQKKLDQIESSMTHGDEVEFIGDYSVDLIWDDFYHKYRRSSDGRFSYEPILLGNSEYAVKTKNEAVNFLINHGIQPRPEPLLNLDLDCLDSFEEFML